MTFNIYFVMIKGYSKLLVAINVPFFNCKMNTFDIPFIILGNLSMHENSNVRQNFRLFLKIRVYYFEFCVPISLLDWVNG